MKFRSTQGITALELLMVVAIMALLVSVVAMPFLGFRHNKILDTGTENILSMLSKARGNTLASKDGYQYGIHFQADRTVLFHGATYNSSDSTNEINILDTALEISSISLTGGGTDVLFDRLTGKTNQDGTITLRVKSDTSKIRTITIIGTGIATVN